jgi:hypothetical protein
MDRILNIVGLGLCGLAIMLLLAAYFKGKKKAWKARRSK